MNVPVRMRPESVQSSWAAESQLSLESPGRHHLLMRSPLRLLLCARMPLQEFCTEPEDKTPAICTKLLVTEAKPEKQTW